MPLLTGQSKIRANSGLFGKTTGSPRCWKRRRSRRGHFRRSGQGLDNDDGVQVVGAAAVPAPRGGQYGAAFGDDANFAIY